MSDKRQDDLARRREVRFAVFERDGGCRFRHDLNPDVPCFSNDLTVHHLRKASAGGRYEMDNLITLCSVANGFVEDNPHLATEMGLVIR